MQGGSIRKKLISICLAALIILINLPIGALAAEAKPSEYDEFISLACDVFPEFSNKIRANNSSYSRNATSSQRKHVYTETRNVSENEYLIYSEYSDGLVLLTNYSFAYAPTYENISSTSQSRTVQVDIKATCNESGYNGIFYLNDVRYTLYFTDSDCIDSFGTYSVSGSCRVGNAGPRFNSTEDSSANAYVQYPLDFWPGDSGYFTLSSLLKIEVGDNTCTITHEDIG